MGKKKVGRGGANVTAQAESELFLDETESQEMLVASQSWMRQRAFPHSQSSGGTQPCPITILFHYKKKCYWSTVNLQHCLSFTYGKMEIWFIRIYIYPLFLEILFM